MLQELSNVDVYQNCPGVCSKCDCNAPAAENLGPLLPRSAGVDRPSLSAEIPWHLCTRNDHLFFRMESIGTFHGLRWARSVGRGISAFAQQP